MCNGIRRIDATDFFAKRLHDLKTTDHTLEILAVAKVKLLPWHDNEEVLSEIMASFILLSI